MSDKQQAIYSPVDERSFLGCVVTSNGDTLDIFKPEIEAFYGWEFRTVYAAILKLHADRKQIALQSVMSELGETAHKLGLENIYDICSFPSPRMAGQFFNTINEKWALRKAKALAEGILAEITPMTDATPFCQNIAAEAASLVPSAACENQLGAACDQLAARLDALERGDKAAGYPAPLDCWNEALGGICNGHLNVIAARPGMGKTALMEQMITAYLLDEKAVLVFEKDMSPALLVERIACRLARVPVWRVTKGIITKEDIVKVRDISETLRGTDLLLYNPTGLTAERMGSITRREKRVKDIQAVFLDHIGVLTVGKDLREGLTAASIAIRNTTTETGIPHIILAHINRNGAKGRPSPEDIKEFDQLFGDCDAMVILWTDADKTKLKSGELLPMKTYFAKNRFGPVTEEPVLFDGALMAFRNPQ